METKEQGITVTPSADALNAHLSAGGMVQVSTYLRSTIYKAKHAGMFYNAGNGDLRVKHGRGSVCLGSKSMLLVGITLYSGVRMP